eukprot:2380713-Pleurochrysis_carterae.AAC.3
MEKPTQRSKCMLAPCSGVLKGIYFSSCAPSVVLGATFKPLASVELVRALKPTAKARSTVATPGSSVARRLLRRRFVAGDSGPAALSGEASCRRTRALVASPPAAYLINASSSLGSPSPKSKKGNMQLTLTLAAALSAHPAAAASISTPTQPRASMHAWRQNCSKSSVDWPPRAKLTPSRSGSHDACRVTGGDSGGSGDSGGGGGSGVTFGGRAGDGDGGGGGDGQLIYVSSRKPNSPPRRTSAPSARTM